MLTLCPIFSESNMIIQSKSNIFRVTLMWLGLFVTIVPFCIVILEWTTGKMGVNIFFQTILILSTIITGLIFILIELPQILALTIDDNKIVTKNLLTGRTKEFLFETIDSFRISTQFGTKSGFHFKLVLLAHGKILETISLSYVDNLNQIMTEMEKRIQNLTEDEYGFLRYIREQQNN
jgi:hypothetical protein